jgi:inosine/xanthosine triphosphatase
MLSGIACGPAIMIVAVGTKNPAKIEGVRKAFARFFPDTELRTMDTASLVRAQPVGFEQIREGAVIRAKYALSNFGGDLGIGVEAGIFNMGGYYFDHQQAAIVDTLGKTSLGHSAGFILPTAAVEKMIRNGGELEQYAVDLTGIEDIGEKGGIINFLTKGAISRTQLTEQCVITALIPWLHKDLYGFS